MSWPAKMLGDLVEIKGGGTPSKSVPEYWGGTIPWASVKDLKGGTLERTDDYITELAISSSSTNVVPAGSIIIPTRMALGKVAVNAVDMAINQDLKALLIKDDSKLSPEYLFRFLESKARFLEGQGKGATVKGITLDVLRVLEIPLPPLPEQKRIAAILDKADAIRRKRQQAIQLADDFLRAVFLDMFGDPVTNPKGLRVVPLISICEKVTDGTHQSPKWESSGVPFLFISNIVDGKINYDTNKFISGETFAELTRTTPIEKGDILYTTVGSYGNVAVVPGDRDFCFQRHIAHIKPSRQMVDPQFLAGMLSSSVVRQQADRLVRGVAQKTLNLRELKEIKVFDLPMKDQENYLRIIDPINKVAERQLFSGRELDKKFNALSQKAFLGQL